MTEQLKEYIESHKAYFWYTPEAEKTNISESLLVETILNNGTMKDVKALIDIMGINHVADVFFSAKGREISNYYPEIRNYFTLLFNRYAYRDTK